MNGLPATVTGGGFQRAAVPLPAQELVQIEAVATDRFGRRASASVGVVRSEGLSILLILDPVPGATTNRDRIDLAGVVVGGRGETLDGKATVGSGAGAAGPRCVDLAARRQLPGPRPAAGDRLDRALRRGQGPLRRAAARHRDRAPISGRRRSRSPPTARRSPKAPSSAARSRSR